MLYILWVSTPIWRKSSGYQNLGSRRAFPLAWYWFYLWWGWIYSIHLTSRLKSCSHFHLDLGLTTKGLGMAIHRPSWSFFQLSGSFGLLSGTQVSSIWSSTRNMGQYALPSTLQQTLECRQYGQILVKKYVLRHHLSDGFLHANDWCPFPWHNAARMACHLSKTCPFLWMWPINAASETPRKRCIPTNGFGQWHDF